MARRHDEVPPKRASRRRTNPTLSAISKPRTTLIVDVREAVLDIIVTDGPLRRHLCTVFIATAVLALNAPANSSNMMFGASEALIQRTKKPSFVAG